MAIHKNWPDHGGPYRWVSGLDTPWQHSPVIPDSDQHDGFPWNPAWIHEETEKEKAQRLGKKYRKRRCGTFWRCLKTLILGSECKEPVRYVSMGSAPNITPDLWKAYGYWARPTINRVSVHNATPGPITPSGLDPHAIFNALLGPNNTPHPERWVARLEHPALPPRPDLPGWQTPHAGSPLAFPWECRLNPFLLHSPYGRAKVTFDMSCDPASIVYAETGPHVTLPLTDADRAQPATYPFLTHVHIKDVADDTAPQFPWPIMIHNPRGITVQDVFVAISKNFELHVAQDEFSSWDERRQAQAGAAYWSRVRRDEISAPHRLARTASEEGCKRIDYMGDRVMFRGLEPSPRGDGTWMLFVGPF